MEVALKLFLANLLKNKLDNRSQKVKIEVQVINRKNNQWI